MSILGIHFHKWIRVQHQEIYRFRGENCKRDINTGYRKCLKCGIIQEYFYDSQGGFWYKVSACETIILDKDIVQEGNKYFLKKYRDISKFTPPATYKIKTEKEIV